MTTPRRHSQTRSLRATVAVAIPTMLIGSGLSASPAQASYMVALAQQVLSGVNSVVASGNGSLDLTGLTLGGSDGTDLPLIDSNSGIVAAGRGADRSSVDKGGEK